MRLGEAVRDSLYFDLRLLGSDARFQARHNFERMEFSAVHKIGSHEGERHPKVGPLRIGLTLGYDADDGERLLVDANLLARDVGVGSEFATPEVFADDGNLQLGAFFGGAEI